MRISVATAVACLSLGAVCAANDARAAIKKQTHIPAQDLSSALQTLAKDRNLQVVFVSEEVNSLRTAGASGELTADEALTKLLRGTELTYRYLDDRTITVAPTALPSSQASALTTQRSGEEAQKAPSFWGQFRLARLDQENANAQSLGQATSDDRSSITALEEVIVTAQKRVERVQDVPMSVKALSGDELRKRGISNTVDIALAVPGVAVQDRGGANRSRYIFMRGLGNTFGNVAMVGVYLDEQDITNFPFQALDMRGYDLERLEALRGPQGTLYGSGAMGGVLRYITKGVDLSGVSGDAYVTAAATENGDPSETVGGSLNLPLVSDKLGVRLSGFYESDGGWIDQPALSKSDGNTQDLYGLRAKILWAPTDALEVSALAMIHRNDTEGSAVGEDEDGNFTQRLGRATTPSGETDYEIYNLTATYSFENFQVISTTGYFENTVRIAETGYILPVFPPPSAPFQVLFLGEEVDTNAMTEELRLSSTGSHFFNWSIGGSYRDGEIRSAGRFFQSLATSSVGLTPFAQAGEGDTKSWAVFGEASLNLTERLKLGAGLRYFEDERSTRSAFNNVWSVLRTGVFDQFSPRVFGTFAMTSDVNLYANVAKGFRSGGFNTDLAIAAGAPLEVSPDKVWSYELGTKGAVFDRRVSFDLAVFHTDYSDAQDTAAQVINGTSIGIAGNVGDAVIRGVDWDIALHLTNTLAIGTGGEYLDGEYTEISPAVVRATVAEGDALKQVPEYHVGLWSEYQLGPWLGGDAGYFRIDYDKQGESVYRNRNAAGSAFGPTPYYFSVSDKIDMLNASIGWQKNNWQLTLFARNLLDDRGFIDGQSLEQLAARSRPRSYGLTIRHSFE